MAIMFFYNQEGLQDNQQTPNIVHIKAFSGRMMVLIFRTQYSVCLFCQLSPVRAHSEN